MFHETVFVKLPITSLSCSSLTWLPLTLRKVPDSLRSPAQSGHCLALQTVSYHPCPLSPLWSHWPPALSSGRPQGLHPAVQVSGRALSAVLHLTQALRSPLRCPLREPLPQDSPSSHSTPVFLSRTQHCLTVYYLLHPLPLPGSSSRKGTLAC